MFLSVIFFLYLFCLFLEFPFSSLAFSLFFIILRISNIAWVGLFKLSLSRRAQTSSRARSQLCALTHSRSKTAETLDSGGGGRRYMFSASGFDKGGGEPSLNSRRPSCTNPWVFISCKIIKNKNWAILYSRNSEWEVKFFFGGGNEKFLIIPTWSTSVLRKL